MDRNRVGQHFPNFEKDFETGQQVGHQSGVSYFKPSASIIPQQMMITMPRGGHDRLEPQGQQLTAAAGWQPWKQKAGQYPKSAQAYSRTSRPQMLLILRYTSSLFVRFHTTSHFLPWLSLDCDHQEVPFIHAQRIF